MSEQQGEQVQQGEAPAEALQGFGPEYVVPGSEEAEYEAAVYDVMDRHPELGTDPAAAQAALATAAHVADFFGQPERAREPGVVEIGHILNSSAPQGPPAPPDPVEQILSGGKGGAGGRVLDF